METAPRNCRFLSLVVVERVLTHNRWFRKSDRPALFWPALGDRETKFSRQFSEWLPELVGSQNCSPNSRILFWTLRWPPREFLETLCTWKMLFLSVAQFHALHSCWLFSLARAHSASAIGFESRPILLRIPKHYHCILNYYPINSKRFCGVTLKLPRWKLIPITFRFLE